jgi:LysM repeat protein
MKKQSVKSKGHFYFSLSSLVLIGLLFFSSSSLAQLGSSPTSTALAFNSPLQESDTADAFFSGHDQPTRETPDLKFIENSFVAGISTPDVVTTQTLGAMFGGQAQSEKVDGVTYIVKSGDTMDQIAKAYKGNVDEIVAANDLASSTDLFIGDHLFIPGGVAPKVSVPSRAHSPIAIPNTSFNSPLVDFFITQGNHPVDATDLSAAGGCGSFVYASNSGTVERSVFNNKWNYGMGNYILIRHVINGATFITYYGHLKYIYPQVVSGYQITADNIINPIAQEGKTGEATGCHVHFEVLDPNNPQALINPFLQYPVGTHILNGQVVSN